MSRRHADRDGTATGSVYLPRSHTTICLQPGTALTREEVRELDEYMLALHPMEGPGGMDPDTGRSPDDDWG